MFEEVWASLSCQRSTWQFTSPSVVLQITGDRAGHLVVSHLFLLIGIAAPVWFTMTGEYGERSAIGVTDRHTSIAMLSGLLTLGARDAVASIIGKKFGRHKWLGPRKSMEGTAAFIGAMLQGELAAQV